MKRLTFEGNFCDIAMCGEVRGGSFCEDGDCSQRKTWERLKAIEDILCDSVGDNDPDAEDDYDLARLAVMCNQRMSMRDEASQRFSLTAKIPLDRLRELVEADREGKVPKYTVGDIIYDKSGGKREVDSAEFQLLKQNESPRWIYRCGHAGTDDYCALWEFEVFPSREAALKAREQND